MMEKIKKNKIHSLKTMMNNSKKFPTIMNTLKIIKIKFF